MPAKINHIAIVSPNYLIEGKFYEAIFNMKFEVSQKGFGASRMSDGYVGININPRHPGRPVGLDHFGVEVEDVESVFDRMRAKYAMVKWLKRPSNRPYAGITTHDPDGNVFDLSQKNMTNLSGIYAEAKSETIAPRRVDHFAVRTMRPELCAEFYQDVLEFTPLNRKDGDPNYYLSDGRITLIVMPWEIQNYEGTGIVRPGPDHIGFKVESVDTVKKEIEDLGRRAGHHGPWSIDGKDEDKARAAMFARTCPLGSCQFSDNDAVLFDIAE